MVVAAHGQLDERIGRYAIFGVIAQGGMARVHLARFMGPEGFSRIVAVKRMHSQFLEDPEFKQMFVAEARLAARVRHPNVVPVLDVLSQSNELLLVMEYVHGESLQSLVRAARSARAPIPLPIACATLMVALQGIHAAHEARDEMGRPLNIVHRDVSPHNIMVGVDGVIRVLDFGVAKAVQAQDARPGMLKGKFSYMAPEVLGGAPASRQSDIFSAAVVFWELLAGRRLFNGATEHERVQSVLQRKYPSPREINAQVPVSLDCIVMKGLSPDPERRYATALEMAIAIERYSTPIPQRLIGEWVSKWAADALKQRAEMIHQIETTYVSPRSSDTPSPQSDQRTVAERRIPPLPLPKAERGPRPRLWMMSLAGAALLAGPVAWFSLRAAEPEGASTAARDRAAAPGTGSSSTATPDPVNVSALVPEPEPVASSRIPEPPSDPPDRLPPADLPVASRAPARVPGKPDAPSRRPSTHQRAPEPRSPERLPEPREPAEGVRDYLPDQL